MKTLSLLLFTVLLVVSALAEKMQMPQLPEAEYADTEVSTNIVIAPLEGSRKFTAEISLYADSTNNIEVAVGCDRLPVDTRLSAAETAFSTGWDGGAWFFASDGLTNRYDATASDSGLARTLLLQIDIRENDTIRNITLTESGIPVFSNAVTAISPAMCKWNIVKATSRGPVATSESITVKTNPYGLGIIFR